MPRRSAPKLLPARKFIAAAFLPPSTPFHRSENIYITFDVDSHGIPRSHPAREHTNRCWPQLCRNRRTDEANPDQGEARRLLDIVEVNPYRDPSGRTAQTAIRLMVDLLAAAF